jgi:hypothetical protein
MPLRVTVTIALLLLIPVLLALHGLGDVYGGIDGKPRRPARALGHVLLLLSIVPALVSVWWRSHGLLVTAAVLLIPVTIVCAFYLIIPVIGIIAFLPLVLWYVYFFRSVDRRNAVE